MQSTIKPSGTALALAHLNREQIMRIADGFAVALAMSLPWSTSATGIFAVLWLVTLVPTLDLQSVRRTLATPAGGLPVLLWGLGVVGTLWADVTWAERMQGLGSFHKLLVIPLLLIHFRSSERGSRVIKGFMLSCVVLLICSWGLVLFPEIPWGKRMSPGVPVKDYISQSAMFTVCFAIAADLAFEAWRMARRNVALAWIVLALMLAANVLFVASRTALVILPIVLLLFGLKRFDWKGVVGLMVAMVLVVAAAWPFSSFLRLRVTIFMQEVRAYQDENAQTSAGERLEFWKKSLTFIAEAPVIGHGTGTIREMFRRAAVGQTGVAAEVSDNPHSQTLAVAIQLGFIGVIALYAMWLAHFLLFRGEGMAAWIGLVVVVQNIVGSLFNSHLFDFTQGWGYVVGVGIAGGVMLRNAPRVGFGAKLAPGQNPG